MRQRLYTRRTIIVRGISGFVAALFPVAAFAKRHHHAATYTESGIGICG